jgi:hypothetical protein
VVGGTFANTFASSVIGPLRTSTGGLVKLSAGSATQLAVGAAGPTEMS